jgi:hypothetical protein
LAAAERARRAPQLRPKRLDARAPEGERVTLPLPEPRPARKLCAPCGQYLPGPGEPPRPCCPGGGVTRDEQERLRAEGLLPVLEPWRWPDAYVDRSADRAMAERLAPKACPAPSAPAPREAVRFAGPTELTLAPLDAASKGGRRGRR